MPININAVELAAIEAYAAESRTVLADGVLAPGAVPYAGGPTKLDGKPFNSMVPPGSPSDVKVLDGLRKGAIAMLHQVRPFGFHAESLGPTLSFNTATDLVTITIDSNNTPVVARQMLVVANFSAAASSASTRVDYWVEVDGVATTKQRFFFGDTTNHHCASGNWLVNLPAGATTIKLRAERGTGSGNVLLDGNDFVALSLWG